MGGGTDLNSRQHRSHGRSSVGGVHYQRVSLIDSADGDVLAINADGSLNLGPLPTGTNTIGSVKITDGTDTALVNTDGQLHVVQRGKLDTGNSTEANLGNGEVFTGTSIDTADYAAVTISIESDQASATDGLVVQYSDDESDWHDGEVYTIVAGAKKFFTPTMQSQYMRVVYTNGATPTTNFHIHTMLRKSPIKWSSHNIDDPIVDQDDAELAKAVITGKNPAGTYGNVNITTDGDLKMSDNSSGLAIAKGDVTGHSFIHKFGKAPDFDTGDGFVTIWDGANDAGVNLMQYTYSTTADIDRISSDSAADTQDIEIQGLDTNYDVVTQTKTLTGQTPVALDTSLIRVFRMKNVNSTDNAGRIFCFKNVATTAGVPNTLANIRAIIQPGNNQTLMAIYTVPNGYTGYMRDWYASLNNNVATSVDIEVRARPFGQVFQVKHTATVNSTGTSNHKHDYTEPEVFAAKTDISMRGKTAGTSVAVSAGFDIVLVAN